MKFLFILLFALFSCTAQSNHLKEKHLIGAEEFSSAIKSSKKIQLIDVRTPGEFQSGHLPDAKNFDWNGQEFEVQISNLDTSRPVYLYCKSGGRSSAAAQALQEKGFEVYELEGGILNWQSKGFPEVKSTVSAKGMNMDEYQALLKDERLVLVDFYAPWCAPCKKMKPYFDKITADMDDKVKVVRIDTDTHPKLTKALKISAIPVIKLYQNGQIIWEHEGYLDEESLRIQLQK